MWTWLCMITTPSIDFSRRNTFTGPKTLSLCYLALCHAPSLLPHPSSTLAVPAVPLAAIITSLTLPWLRLALLFLERFYFVAFPACTALFPCHFLFKFLANAFLQVLKTNCSYRFYLSLILSYNKLTLVLCHLLSQISQEWEESRAVLTTLFWHVQGLFTMGSAARSPVWSKEPPSCACSWPQLRFWLRPKNSRSTHFKISMWDLGECLPLKMFSPVGKASWNRSIAQNTH